MIPWKWTQPNRDIGREIIEALQTAEREIPIAAPVREPAPAAGPKRVDTIAPRVLTRDVKATRKIRIDRDILSFFKAQGAGYEARMNAVLREHMERNSPR